MTPELWARLNPLFAAAVEKPPGERDAFVAEACGDDSELLRELIALVEAHEQQNATADKISENINNLIGRNRSAFSPGEVVSGRFRIVRKLGSGGMGDVYEAFDLELSQAIALKSIRPEIVESTGVLSRFRKEVQFARRLNGPNVCRIHELFIIGSSAAPSGAFLTMELLDGITLSERIRQTGPISWREAQALVNDICVGLATIHEAGIIHRDLKSRNIMLVNRAGSVRAVVMDFGLAHEVTSSNPEADTALTVSGVILGTPEYMAPEQFEGREATPATDLFALGIVLYEMLTGKRPFPSSTILGAAVLRGKRPETVSSTLRGIPHRFDVVIGKCLEYDASRRYQSAEEVAQALRTGPANLKNLRLDRPWLFRVACALILAAFAWGVFAFWQQQVIYKPGPEALQEYNDGLSLIRQGNYAEATRVLQEALKKEQNFVMAHARLSEAWYNLDFQGSAQQELLIAIPRRDRLSPLDRMYLDAIQETVTGDASSALETRRRILDRLAPAQRSSGYVDLGMAYERAGDIPHALESYSHAAQLDGNNPAAYMHTGILQSRLHHVKEGDEAFNRAQAIFEEEIDSHGGKGNPEGLAELDYERGYAANDRGDPKDAAPLLQRSSGEAAQIPSPQLEIRALAQLSVADRESDQYALALKDAGKAIQLARDNQLESWAADGLVQLASAELDQEHLKEAEEPLQEATQILEQSPQPRVQAFADLTLASLMNQEHLPAKVIAPAQAALQYYKSHGFFSDASNAALLLIRAERDQGQYRQALASGNDYLALAAESGSPLLRVLTEDVVGTAYLKMEQYPNALVHFQNARLLATKDSLRAYMELHCADALWRLGRYPESEEMFKLASGNRSLLAIVSESRVSFLQSQQKYGPALKLAKQLIDGNPDMVADRKVDLEQDETVAEAHLGMKTQALAGLSAYFVPDQSNDDPADSAQQKLAVAELYLSLGMNRQAYDAAVASHGYFASSGQPDSELQSACLAAAASKALKDDANYRLFSRKALDILARIQQTWGPEDFQKFVSRPDIHSLTMRVAQ